MNTQLLILTLAGILAPCALAAAPGQGDDRDSTPLLDEVMAVSHRVVAEQIVDCQAIRLPTSVEVGRYLDASSFAESDHAVGRMRREIHRACLHAGKVRLVFLVPIPNTSRQTASVRIEATP